MKNVIKWMLLILVAISMVSMIAFGGCKVEKAEESKEEVEEEVEEKVEEKIPSGKITMWSWHDIDEDVAALFMEEYPEIEVEFLKLGPWDIEDKLLTSIASGRGAADVIAIVSRRFQRFASGTGIADITEYVDDVSGDFLETPLNMYNDRIYGLPVSVAVVATHYRRDLFEEYDLEVPKTMADLYEIKEKLPEGKYVLPIFVPSGQWGADSFRAYLQIAGGNIFDENGKVIENNEIGKEVMNWYYNLVKDEVAITGTWFTLEWYAAIGQGEVVLAIENISESRNLEKNFPELAGNWGSAPVPTWEEGSPAITGNWGIKGFCVPAQSQNIEAAAEYVKWVCTSDTAQTFFSENFWFSAYEPFNQNSGIPIAQPNEYLGGTNLLEDVFKARDIASFNFIDWVQTSDILGQEIDTMFNDEKTPDQAWDDFEARLISEKLGMQ